MALGEQLGAKLGPLPVYAWGGLAGVTILIGETLYRRANPATVSNSDLDIGPVGAAAPAASPSIPAQSSLDGSFMAAGSYSPAGTFTPPQATTAGPPALTDNDEWLRSATTLVAAGNASLGMVQIGEALKAYLDGRPVTEQQAAIVELALRSTGQPPFATPAIQILPQNNPTPIITPPPDNGAGTVAAPPPVVVITPPPPPPPPPPPAPAPFPPAWLGNARFVKGTGNAIYLVTPTGLSWVPSEGAFYALGGSFGRAGEPPANYLTIPDSALGPLPRVGTLPAREFDPSLP